MSERLWFKSYDSAVPHSLEPYPAIPLYGFLEQAARDYPDSTALIFKPSQQSFAGSQMSYRALNDASDRLAAALVNLGVKKGERVVIFMPNSPQFVISYFAILKVGGVVVATNPLYSPREIEHQMVDSGAETMLVMSNFYTRVKEIQAKTKLKTIIVTSIKDYMPPLLKLLFSLAKEKKEGHKPDIAPGDLRFQDLLKKYTAAQRTKVEVGPDDIALLQYTGGTTGVPKGAVALHRNLVADALQIKAWIHDTRPGQEMVLLAIPLFHVYGMVAGMCYGMAAAASLLLTPNPRDLPNLLAAINQYKPTIFPGVPTLYNAINNYPDIDRYDIRSIRACISGSAPLLAETQNKFEALTGGNLREGYGLSEAPTASHCNPLRG
ncbi:MAG: AMP-binding protein, partial [Thermoflexales bacterium]|nr:AMP-binding protein [Thermoflexales bacterium]